MHTPGVVLLVGSGEEGRTTLGREMNDSLFLFRARMGDAGCAVVQNYSEKRSVDGNLSVIIDKAEIPEFVHEFADSRARRTYHFGQCLLSDFGNLRLRLIQFPISGHQQQDARQALLA